MKIKKVPAIRTAESFGARLTGLMGRTLWPKRLNGLLFPECGSLHTFFTPLHPDILFLDRNFKILRLVPSAKSWRFYFGPSGTRHCLELSPECSKRLRLKTGDVIQCVRV